MRRIYTSNEVLTELIRILKEIARKSSYYMSIFRDGFWNASQMTHGQMHVVVRHTAGVAGQRQTGVITLLAYCDYRNISERSTRESRFEEQLQYLVSMIPQGAIKWEQLDTPQVVDRDESNGFSVITTRLKYSMLHD